MALSGLVFNVDLDPKEKKAITDLIVLNNGVVTYLASSQVTHLVTTQENIAKNGFKIQSAKKYNNQIVTVDFVYDKISEYVPPVITETEKVVQGTFTVFKPALPSLVPVVTTLLPKEGTIDSTFKVSVIGDNFKSTSDLRIKFGNFICHEIEYHCPSAVIATVRAQGLPPGEVEVAASNNAGRDWGNVCKFTFKEGEEDTGIQSWHRQELKALRNKIFQLQTDLLDVQRMEFTLSNKFEEAISYPARLALPPSVVQHTTPPIQVKVDRKEVLQIKDKMKKQQQQVVGPSEDVNREARIFISSPFKDMNEERDLMVKRIIPKLRKLCLERDIVLSCVDLRWGVTEAQTQGAATLLMCLREIERSNIFIGLYGERYGWCLTENSYRKPTAQDELLMRTFSLASKEFPWINQYKDRSVTEIEMRMVFEKHSKEKQKAGWFYLRDPYYVESVSSDKKNDFLSEGEYEMSKLVNLKKDITNSSFPSTNYHRPTHLAELLYEDLKGIIDQKYPQGTELNPFKRERFLHSTYARNLTRVYLPNEKYFMNLDRYASSNTLTPLVVFGDIGVGKSALLANWSKRYKQHHPEVVVIDHWIGCTASSSKYSHLLRRIMDELQDFLADTTDDIPSDLKEMEKIFPSWLEKTLNRNKVGRVVIIVDGLDNLEEMNNAHTLLWLPLRFPPSVRMVLSVAPSRPLDMVRKREYEMMEILPIEEGERASFTRQYLDMHSKKLSESQEHRIARCPQTGNPRYLKVLLEDISIWGHFDELDKRIESDLRANDTSQLYEIVLERLEKDYDKDGKEIVKLFMSFIWASRRGLMLDAELGHLLEAQHIDYNTWQALYLGVEELLFSSGGLLNFANHDIQRAVESRYLKDNFEKQRFHSLLAEFFDKHIEGVTDRKVEELAFQLFHAEDWTKLQACITNLSMFNKLYTGSKFDLYKYWRSLDTQFDVVDCYITALERGDSLPTDVIQGDLFYQVGHFLDDMAKYEGATKVFAKARNLYNVSSQNLAVAKTDYSIARIMEKQAKYTDAEDLFNKCLQIYTRERGDEDHTVAGTLTRLGSLYLTINKFDKSEECFQKALRIRKSKLGPNHWKVAKCLTQMITFYEMMRQFEKGIDCGNQALKIAEEEFGPDDMNLTNILVSIGRIHMVNKKFEEAKALFKRALRIAEEKVGNHHPRTADIVYELGCFFFIKPEDLGARVNNQIIEKFKQKDFWNKRDYSQVTLITKKQPTEAKENKKGWSLDRAEKFFLRALTIFENTVGTEHPDYARVLNRLGSLYIERVQYLKAEEHLQKALAIWKKKLGPLHSRVGQTYKHLFTLYNLQEKLEESHDCGLKALEVFRNINGEQSIEVSNVYERLGDQYGTAGKREEAKEYLLKAKAIRTSILGPDHKNTIAIDLLIQSLSAPPPPPPPPPMCLAVEELLSQANVEITSEMKQQKGRNDLLDAIKNFGKIKEQLASAEQHSKLQKKAANLEEKKGWWRQNYQAGFNAQEVKQKTTTPIISKPAVRKSPPPPPPPKK